MYQFYTAEIIKTQEGEFEHDIKWHYDENEQTAQLKGEAKLIYDDLDSVSFDLFRNFFLIIIISLFALGEFKLDNNLLEESLGEG